MLLPDTAILLTLPALMSVATLWMGVVCAVLLLPK